MKIIKYNKCPICNTKQPLNKVVFEATDKTWECKKCNTQIEHDGKRRFKTIILVFALFLFTILIDSFIINEFWITRGLLVIVAVYVLSNNRLIAVKNNLS